MYRGLFLIFTIIFSALAAQAQDKNFFVFLNTNPNRYQMPPDSVRILMQDHLANIDRLAKAGTIIAAGPFEKEGGMFVCKAKDEKEVLDSVNTDPAVKANRYIIHIHPMNILRGEVGEVEDGEMTTLCSITLRFAEYGPRGLFPKQMTEEIDGWIDYLEKLYGNVHFACSFGDGIPVGAFIITDAHKEKRAAAVNYKHPGPSWFEAEVRDLWTAKGIFKKKE